MLPSQLGPPLHVKHASLPNSITKTKPGSSDPRMPLPNAHMGVRFQPAEGGEFSTGADTGVVERIHRLGHPLWAGKGGKPSIGLEPTISSLPWNDRGGTRGYERARMGKKPLQ